VYATKDNSFVRIHTNFPQSVGTLCSSFRTAKYNPPISHRKGVLDILNLPDRVETSREQVASAILQWNAEDLEEEAAKRGMCIVAYRSFKLWDRHPQAESLKSTLPVTIIRVDDGIPGRDGVAKEVTDQPLQGTKVLDLTRVLAGPIAGRTLAGEFSSTTSGLGH
jgi:crotonobetainyl-CoA:carnitine CoA-transferase CaiB-like acyl-CoA transferase